MCLFLPMGSQAPESHTRWGHPALQSRVILDSWVGDTNVADNYPEMRLRPSFLNGAPLTHDLIGVIPRAASALFEKLAGPPTMRRSESSGLRTPTRYSMHSTMGLAALAKAQALASEDKNWQMKATYVEVGFCCCDVSSATKRLLRYTTSNCETCWYQNRYHWANGRL